MARQLVKQQYHSDKLLATVSMLNVIDSFPIELLFPIRQGRSARQLGGKNKDKGRWSIGVKLCWIINTFGLVVGWPWVPMNQHDQAFLALVDVLQEDGVVLADLGFRCKEERPDNLHLCAKGTHNERMWIETTFPC